MENEKKFEEWASTQLGYDKEKARHIYSKLKHGRGEELWEHIVKHTRNVREKYKAASAALLYENLESTKEKERENDSDDLVQQKRSLEEEIKRLETDVDNVVRAIMEKEDELKNLQHSCQSLQHKAFLLDQHASRNKIIHEEYSVLNVGANDYYKEMVKRMTRNRDSHLFMIDGKSPFKETAVYRDFESMVESHADKLLKQAEMLNKAENQEMQANMSKLESDVSDLMKKFSVRDVFQSMKVHAKTSISLVNSFSDKPGSNANLITAEKNVSESEKALEKSFQNARDEYIRNFFDIEEDKQIIEETNTKINAALQEYDSKLQVIFEANEEDLELAKSLIRLELKCCRQKEMIAFLKGTLEQTEKSDQRALMAMKEEIVQSEKDLFQNLSKASDAIVANKNLISMVMNKQKELQLQQLTISDMYKTNVKQLLASVGDSFNDEVDCFVKLKMEKLLVTKVGEKRVRVYDLSVHKQKSQRMKSIMSTVCMQPFHAAETFLPKVHSFLLNVRENEAFIENWSTFGKDVEEIILSKNNELNQFKSEHLRVQKSREKKLIPHICDLISKANSAIKMSEDIARDVSYCYNWNQAYVKRILDNEDE